MSQLFGRSTIVDGKKTITGDSLFHNDKLKQNEGFGNVIYTTRRTRTNCAATTCSTTRRRATATLRSAR